MIIFIFIVIVVLVSCNQTLKPSFSTFFPARSKKKKGVGCGWGVAVLWWCAIARYVNLFNDKHQRGVEAALSEVWADAVAAHSAVTLKPFISETVRNSN
jgi:hypothetical protein